MRNRFTMSSHSVRLSFLATMLLAVLPPALVGQQAPSSSIVGERVRVTPIEVEEPLIGTVTSLGPDAMQLSGSGGGVRSLGYDEIAGVERSLGRSNSAGKGLAIGAGTGLVLGGLFGIWLVDEICGSCDPEYAKAFFGFGAMGLASGALLGLAIGAAISTERWEGVPFGPGRTTGLILGPNPASGGGVLIGLRLPFDPTRWTR